MGANFFADYSWYELWNPFPFIIVAFLSYFYTKKVLLSNRYHVPRVKAVYFYMAMGLFVIIKGTPLKPIANDYLFSAHVFEVMALLFIILPFLILSFPAEMYRQYFWNHRLKTSIKFFGHPWLAALLFNSALTAYFVPMVFNSFQQNAFLVALIQLFLFIAGFFMWWTIIMPLPEITKFSYFTRVAYIFLNAVLLMPIGVFLLIVTSYAHYPVYEAVATELLPWLTAVYDQQLGGGILKTIQLTSYGIALFYLIFNWSKQEEELEGQVEDENVRIVQGIVIHLPNKK